MNESLKEVFSALATSYRCDANTADVLWQEIADACSGRNRHYHSLAHLGNMLEQLQPCRTLVDDWDAVLFALYYHDIVYNVLKHDNEEQSAVLAGRRLAGIGFPADRAERCQAHIMATRQHQLSTDNDTNLFTDADLCILGQSPGQYAEYTRNVRKEYGIYPDIVYKPGRRKVLAHFLHMERIFKTSHFYDLFEQEARKNLAAELEVLG